MARAKVVHSDDACTIIFKGDKSKPEPSTGIIKFPGGYVEVSRTTDGSYWAHMLVDDPKSVINSRIDYDHLGWVETQGNIPDVPMADHIQHVALRIATIGKEGKQP